MTSDVLRYLSLKKHLPPTVSQSLWEDVQAEGIRMNILLSTTSETLLWAVRGRMGRFVAVLFCRSAPSPGSLHLSILLFWYPSTNVCLVFAAAWCGLFTSFLVVPPQNCWEEEANEHMRFTLPYRLRLRAALHLRHYRVACRLTADEDRRFTSFVGRGGSFPLRRVPLHYCLALRAATCWTNYAVSWNLQLSLSSVCLLPIPLSNSLHLYHTLLPAAFFLLFHLY